LPVVREWDQAAATSMAVQLDLLEQQAREKAEAGRING